MEHGGADPERGGDARVVELVRPVDGQEPFDAPGIRTTNAWSSTSTR